MKLTNRWMIALSGASALAQAIPAQLPWGFAEKDIAPKAAFKEATGMAFTHDGRILISERGGDVKLVSGENASVIYRANTTTEREQGLLKILAHPDFAAKRWLYLYHTTSDYKSHLLTRLTLDSAFAVKRVDTLVRLPALENAGRHNGAGMVFGKDGYLYLGRGQDELTGGSNPAPWWNSVKGKILRYTEDGKPAPGNPHYSAAGVSEGEKSIWARGFRNPWSMAVDRISGRIFVGDVGDGTEELNEVTAPDPGKDHWYGYGSGDGVGAGGGKAIDPLYYHGTGAKGECAIVGEVPYNAAIASNWPASYKNRIYVADYCASVIRSVPLAAQGSRNLHDLGYGMEIFHLTAGKMVGLFLGPDGNLYYVNYGNAGKAVMIHYRETTGLARGVSERISPETVFLRANDPRRIRFRMAGGAPEGGAVELIVRGIDGAVHMRRAVSSVPGGFEADGLGALPAGIYVAAFRGTGTETLLTAARLTVLP